MDFRPREALFFGDNFFRFGPVGSKFSHLRGEPSKTPQVPKTPYARFSEMPDRTHFFNLSGKQKSFGENTVKVWWVLLSLCLFYAVKCVFCDFLMLITRQNIWDNSLFIGCLVLCFCGDQKVLFSQPLQQEFVAPHLSNCWQLR